MQEQEKHPSFSWYTARKEASEGLLQSNGGDNGFLKIIIIRFWFIYYVRNKATLLNFWFHDNSELCSVCGVCSSGGAVACPQPGIACRVSVVTLCESGRQFSFSGRRRCHGCFWAMHREATRRKSENNSLTVVLLSEHLNILGNVSIIRQLKQWSENAFLTRPLDPFLSFPVIQEEGCWLLILQRSPASEPGGGWRYWPARLRSQTECGSPALPRRQ